MAAYPFYIPTWEEVIKTMEEEGVAFCEKSIPGEDLVQFFEKAGNVYPVNIESREDHCMPSQLRSLCSAMEVDADLFGFNLG